MPRAIPARWGAGPARRPAVTLTAVSTRVFAARLAGTAVFDPIGDQVGRVRDVVVLVRPTGLPRATGLVVEVAGRRRVFVPLSRITSMDAGQVISTGLLNMRRFEQRPTESLVIGELLDRRVELVDGSGPRPSSTSAWRSSATGTGWSPSSSCAAVPPGARA